MNLQFHNQINIGVTFIKSTILYSMVFFFLFVRVLIQPFLTFTAPPSTLLPTWHTPPVFFHLMSWNMWPILFLHLNVSRDFACSITLLVSNLSSWFFLQFSREEETFETVLFSHEATPFPSNLIDMNESSVKVTLKSFSFLIPSKNA